MYRSTRRANKTAKKNNSHVKLKDNQVKNMMEIEEVLPPKDKRELFKDKLMTNRCCFATPDQKDFGQITSQHTEQYQTLLFEQYGIEPIIPETINRLKELRKVLCGSITSKVENCSQYTNPKKSGLPISTLEDSSEDVTWQSIDNGDDIELYVKDESLNNEDEAKMLNHGPQKLYISETPRIKVIAEKFSRFKKNNIEVRKLDEKIVCLEYDIYERKSKEESGQPTQKMRAYFSIQPTFDSEDIPEKEKAQAGIPPGLKQQLNVDNNDFNLDEKEIEIIDGHIIENKPYLEDLRRILKNKQAIYSKKNKGFLDLNALYQMAKREIYSVDQDESSTDFLSKTELQDVKNLILKKCSSSVHGISRRTVKRTEENKESVKNNIEVVSQSIVTELIRDLL